VITPRELVDATLVTCVAVTADGTKALYVLARPEETRLTTEAWVHPMDGDGPSPLVPAIEGIERLVPGPDPRSIAVVATSGGSSRLIVVDLTDGVARELVAIPTAMPGVAMGSDPIRDAAWSPDGAWIAYVASATGPDADRPAYVEVSDHVRVIRTPGYEEDGVGALPLATAQLMVVSTASGEVRRVSSTPDDHDTPMFSPDGRWIAVRRRAGYDTYHADIVLYDLEADHGVPPEVIGEGGGVVDWASWSPGGERLVVACRATDPPSPARELRRFDRSTGELRTIAPDPIGEPLDPPIWIDESRILVHAMRRAKSVLFELDVDTGASSIVAEFDGGHHGFATDGEGRLAIQTRETLRGSGEVVRVDLCSGDVRSLIDPNRRLFEDASVAPPTRLDVMSDGFELDVSILRPEQAGPREPLPTVFAIHGGPNDVWGGDFVDVAFLLASNGYQVAMPNVRGSVTYGRAFAEAEQADYGGGELRDLMAVVDAIAELPGTDRERLGITGGSHGGYLTALAVAMSDRFAAAVCARPLIDLASKWATSDAGAYWGDLYHGGAPWDERDLYLDRSPATHAHRTTTPTLIVAGEDDLRCKVDQAKQLFTILHRVGCETELVLYPGASHGFGEAGSPRDQRIDYFERLLGWFDRHLRRQRPALPTRLAAP